MPDAPRSLYVILGELAFQHPKLVLMRGRNYFRIEDLWRWARKDLKSGDPAARKALEDPIYWIARDPGGKLLLKGARPDGGEFVAYVEPGSELQTTVA